MNHPKKFLVIEDHYVVSWALKVLIEETYRDAIVESATTFEDGLKLLNSRPVDLIILDVGLPGAPSGSMIGMLRNVQPQVNILIYSGKPESEFAVKFLSEGASGFVSKDQPMETVKDAISAVLEDKKYISKLTYEAIAGSFLDRNSRQSFPNAPIHLTPREHDVILLLLQGKWTKEIASQLGLRVTTVSTHKTHILEKFGVENPIDLFKAVQIRMPHLIEK